MTERTWKIRDQLSSGKWGPEREVTLAQYRAEIDAAKVRAMQVIYTAIAQEVGR